MFELSLLQRSLISFAMLVTFGVLVHDTKIDQATALALTLPVIGFSAAAHMVHDAGTDHTHVERASMGQTAAGNARMQARDDHRKYVLVKHIKGDTTSDSHHLVLSSPVEI